MPPSPKVTTVVPAADQQSAVWRYSTTNPGTNWFLPDFDASGWREGQSGFGTSQTPGARVGTRWNGTDIWLRREVEIPADQLGSLELWMHHDEDARVYVNGILAVRAPGYTTGYETIPLNANGERALKAGRNLIAVHCHQVEGGQYIDLGIVTVK